jgi:hypothetical protein
VYMIFVKMKTLANFMTTGSNYERKRFKWEQGLCICDL